MSASLYVPDALGWRATSSHVLRVKLVTERAMPNQTHAIKWFSHKITSKYPQIEPNVGSTPLFNDNSKPRLEKDFLYLLIRNSFRIRRMRVILKTRRMFPKLPWRVLGLSLFIRNIQGGGGIQRRVPLRAGPRKASLQWIKIISFYVTTVW